MTTAIRSTATWAAPDARLILKASADGSPEWLATRRTGITSTGATVLGGVNTRSNLYSLWASYFDDPTDDPSMADLYWYGHEVEPMLARRFEDKTGIGSRNVGTYAHREYRHHLANPDRFTADGGVLSIKSAGLYTDDAKIWLAGECTDYAQVQEQWVLWVTGRSHAWYIAIVDRRPVIVGPIARDEACIAALVEKAERFWPCVENRTPPPIDYASASPEEMLTRFREIIHPEAIAEAAIPQQALADVARLAEIRALASQARASEKEERDIKTRLTMQIGEKEFLGVPDGKGGLKPIAHWKQVNQTLFRQKDLQAEEPELAAKYTVKGKTRRLEIVKDGAP